MTDMQTEIVKTDKDGKKAIWYDLRSKRTVKAK